MLKEKKMWISI